MAIVDPADGTAALHNIREDVYPVYPLKSSGKQIRLLELHPGQYHSPLSGRLRVVSLGMIPTPRYQALSYTWGDATKNDAIRIHGCGCIPITGNLFQALRRLRRRLTTRILWVDAICINQGDPIEKSHQIFLMSEVYKIADKVIVWLGETFLHRFSIRNVRSRYEEFRMLINHLDEPSWRQWLYGVLHFQPLALEDALTNTNPQWHTRIWVQQEFVLARRVVFRYGTWSLDYESYKALCALCFFRKLGYRGMQKFWNFRLQMEKLDGSKHERNGGKFDLHAAMYLVSDTYATDPRDKIYSMLGLLEDESKLIVVDYSRSLEQVYGEATYAIIVATQSLEAVESIEDLFHRPSSSQLPSWVVDFREKWSHWPRPQVSHPHTESQAFTPTISADLMRLRITGMVLDTVMETRSLVEAGKFTWSEYLYIDELGSVQIENVVVELLMSTWRRMTSVADEQGSGAHVGAVDNVKAMLSFTGPLWGREGGLLHLPSLSDYLSVVFASWRGYRWDSTLLSSTSSPVQEIRTGTPMLTCDPADKIATDLEDLTSSCSEYLEYLNNLTAGLLLVTTLSGRVGLAPVSICPGDAIVFCNGAQALWFLQKQNDCWRFRGQAYIHGLLDSIIADGRLRDGSWESLELC